MTLTHQSCIRPGHPATILQPSCIQRFNIIRKFEISGQQDGFPYAHTHEKGFLFYHSGETGWFFLCAYSVFYPAILICIFYLYFQIDKYRMETGWLQDDQDGNKKRQE